MGDVMRFLNEENAISANVPLRAKSLADMIQLIEEAQLVEKWAKENS